jgi:hypothetical protein
MTSIIRLFWRFMQAFGRSCWWKLRGYEIIASQRTMRTREQVCGVCPYRDEDSCSLCGCLIYSKITLYAEQCPRKFWLREKVASATRFNDC